MTNGASRSNTVLARGNMPSAGSGSTGSEPEQPKQGKGPRASPIITKGAARVPPRPSRKALIEPSFCCAERATRAVRGPEEAHHTTEKLACTAPSCGSAVTLSYVEALEGPEAATP